MITAAETAIIFGLFVAILIYFVMDKKEGL